MVNDNRMFVLFEVPSLNQLLYAEPQLNVQISLLLIQAIVWKIVIPIGMRLVQKFVENKPWKEQWIERNMRTFEGVGIFLSKEMGADFAAMHIPILMQHGIGGMLTLPSILGFSFMSPKLRVALACHGALCEGGWELQDGLERIYQIFTDEEPLKRNPWSLRRLMAFHHALGLSSVIPVNMSQFRSSVLVHEAIFLLQGAACFALAAQQYAFTLDIGTRSGMFQMWFVSCCTFLTLLYTRFVRYVPLAITLYFQFHAEGYSGLAYVTMIAALLMSRLNYLFIRDGWNKVVKYSNMLFVEMSKKEKLK